MQLENKIALVTGAGCGIGRATALEMAREGADIVVNDLNKDSAEETATMIKELGREGIALQADVGTSSEVNRVIAQALKEFGRIDILVNNAGTYFPHEGGIVNLPDEAWQNTLNVNLNGPFYCARAVLGDMIHRKEGGKIINIGSDAGRVGEYQEAVYGACKGGVIALSKALARELGRYNVNVNVVCPGLTLPEKSEDAGAMSLWHSDSPQSRIFRNEETLAKVVRRYPLRRHGLPTDIVPLVLLLASDQSSYVTGQVISVSGGYAM